MQFYQLRQEREEREERQQHQQQQQQQQQHDNVIDDNGSINQIEEPTEQLYNQTQDVLEEKEMETEIEIDHNDEISFVNYPQDSVSEKYKDKSLDSFGFRRVTP